MLQKAAFIRHALGLCPPKAVFTMDMKLSLTFPVVQYLVYTSPGINIFRTCTFMPQCHRAAKNVNLLRTLALACNIADVYRVHNDGNDIND